MNKKTKKIASLVLGITLAGTAFTGCASGKSSCAGHMGDKKSMDKKASCGSKGCGSNDKK